MNQELGEMMSSSGSAESPRDRILWHHPVLGDLPDESTIHFTLDGRELDAFEGDSIASALLANGVRVFRAAPHSGEPRGPFCAVGRCPDCMMTVDGVLNVQTCVTPVKDGMRVETQQGLGKWTGGNA